MTIEHKTSVDQMEVRPSGVVQVRLTLDVVEDGNVLAQAWHRTAVAPGDSAADQMALVNDHLKTMGRAVCPSSEIARLAAVAAAVHTPAVIEAWQQRMADLADS